MTMTYIETASVTNEWLRAVAGAHRLCVGYPDGVPETWRTVSAAQQGGGAAHPMRCAGRLPLHYYGGALVCQSCGNPAPDLMASRSTYPDGELDPAALLGPAAEPYTGDAVGLLRESSQFRHFTEMAAMRQQVKSAGCEPVDWPERDAAGDEEC